VSSPPADSELDQLTGAARDHLFMNVDDMRELGLAQDAVVIVRSAHGELRARAFAADVQRGNLQAHWPEANVLIAPAVRDPGGLVPDYNAVVQLIRPDRAERRAGARG
jgi:anaerobic selenocysteine-containing dehydrogenase